MGAVKHVFKTIGSIVGIGSTPKVSDAADKTVAADQAKANTGRAALYGTQGDQEGEELDPNQVQKRQNLLGN